MTTVMLGHGDDCSALINESIGRLETWIPDGRRTVSVYAGATDRYSDGSKWGMSHRRTLSVTSGFDTVLEERLIVLTAEDLAQQDGDYRSMMGELGIAEDAIVIIPCNRLLSDDQDVARKEIRALSLCIGALNKAVANGYLRRVTFVTRYSNPKKPFGLLRLENILSKCGAGSPVEVSISRWSTLHIDISIASVLAHRAIDSYSNCPCTFSYRRRRRMLKRTAIGIQRWMGEMSDDPIWMEDLV